MRLHSNKQTVAAFTNSPNGKYFIDAFFYVWEIKILIFHRDKKTKTKKKTDDKTKFISLIRAL